VADLDTFMQYAYISAEEAIRQSELRFDLPRTGIVMGTALAGLALTGNTQEALAVDGKNVSPKFLSKIMGNIAAAQLSISYGIKGPSFTVSTACSSGGDAIAMAAMLLEADAADAMVVMAGESAISPLLIQSLYKSGALSKSGQSRPFDKSRDGFVIGEGGGALILETEENALRRGAEVQAELLGYANNTDAYNPVAPEPDGGGAAACIRLALKKAGLAPEDVGYINAHGTATVAGDIAESKAIRAVFGALDVPISSTKGATGHMMGAGGITETIACIKAIQTGVLPPTIHCEEVDGNCDIHVICDFPAEKHICVAMSNALGFGGQNSSIVLKKY
jgi:3-oxoacyl-(acyl-carrier-protein) synthase